MTILRTDLSGDRTVAIEPLEALGEALLDFTHPEELTRWLAHHSAATQPRQD